jgi:putative thioredoxin
MGNMRGAVDLSKLAQPQPDPSRLESNAAKTDSVNIEANEHGQFVLPSLVIEVDQDSIRRFLPISAHVPILVDFYTTRSTGSAQLSNKLASEVARRNGSVILLRLNGDLNHPLLEAFKIEGLPAVAGILKGQPVPLFAGDQTLEAISTVIDKMLEVAKDNGIVGTAVSESGLPAEPELPAQHRVAYEAMESGDFDAAVVAFEKILADTPADVWAAAGLAQAKLLKRTDGIDLDEAVLAPVDSVSAAIAKADAHAVCGEFEESFEVLLGWFASAPKPEQDSARQHLLDLFQVATAEHPAVAKARIKLANLLY